MEISEDMKLFADRKKCIAAIRERAETLVECQHQPYTFVLLEIKWDGKLVQGFGFSKVCYPDKFDSDKGLEIARGRAVSRLYDLVQSAMLSNALIMLVNRISNDIAEKLLEQDDEAMPAEQEAKKD